MLNGFLQESNEEFTILKLTEKSKEVLFNRKKVNLQKVKEFAKAVTVAEKENYYPKNEVNEHPDLFDELRVLRRQQAEQENVPPYVIFSDATLLELANYLPHTKEDLDQINGFGAFKIEKYGEIFLDLISEYCSKNNLTSKISEKKPKKQSTPKKENQYQAGTYTTTFQMYKAGNNIEDIAKIRNLSVNTIQTHLVNFVEVGTIKPSELMDTNKIEPIISIAKSQNIPSLKAIKEELGEEYSYFEIHVALAFYKLQEKKWQNQK